MNTATVTALKESIAKWEDRAKGNFLIASCGNCPLCKLFCVPSMTSENECAGCPVYARTKIKYCGDTPVENYHAKQSAESNIWYAKQEVAFLKSLLPA